MIATAMMITVIGQHEPASQLDNMPWEVDQLDNGSLRVFGLTLEKTSIQEANQIFASFGKTRLQVSTNSNGSLVYQLVSIFDELTFGGLTAQIILSHQVEQAELEAIYRSLDTTSKKSEVMLLPVTSETEMHYLNSVISSITYIPSIDYGLETIRQNFGQASTETKISDELQLWDYPKMGLQIQIHSTKPDRFVYAALK